MGAILDELLRWWPLLTGLVAVGIAYGMLASGQKHLRRDSEKGLDAKSKEMHDLENRIDRVNTKLEGHVVDSTQRLTRIEAKLETILQSVYDNRGR